MKWRPYLLLAVSALIVTLPLMVNGCSCGHDFGFHLQSWLDAAQQFRHGTLHPQWAFSAAYNAGEPRFVFYPPLSWTLGALLTFLFPITALPAVYTFIVLAAAGFAMHRLAREFVPLNIALIAAALYLANPYMLFNAFERTAYAELLAAVWMPLLSLAVLRERPTVRGIALPLALLWLTNAPAAVMGSYTLAVVVIVRVAFLSRRQDRAGATDFALTSLGGGALGLGLAAFYIVPAAYERRFVQIAMAIIPNMRFQDNFLFGHTADVPHNVVLHTASMIAVTLLCAASAALVALHLNTRRKCAEAASHSVTRLCLTALAVCIAFLVTPLSTPLWNHLPELSFLQFPWRLLSVLAVALALTIALLLRNTRLSAWPGTLIALVLVAVLTYPAIRTFRQRCLPPDSPADRLRLFQTHRGADPTDEYTPVDADNDVLRANDPPYWTTSDPRAFALNTTPNPATFTIPQSQPPAPTNGEPATGILPETFAPFDIVVDLPKPEFVILNLRDYPNWHVTRRSLDMEVTEVVHEFKRDDGLMVIPVPYGRSSLHIEWQKSREEYLGDGVSAIAILTYLGLRFRGARTGRIEV